MCAQTYTKKSISSVSLWFDSPQQLSLQTSATAECALQRKKSSKQLNKTDDGNQSEQKNYTTK